MKDFHTRLTSLVSKEAAQGDQVKNREEHMAHMIEALSRALGFTVAIAADGNAEAMDKLITGAEHYALEKAASIAPMAEIMAGIRRRK